MGKFERDLIEGLKDAVDHSNGKNTAVRRVHVVQVPDVRAIREALKMSQSEFARTYRIPLSTLQGWEQGRRQPDAPAAALLRVIARKPREAKDALAL